MKERERLRILLAENFHTPPPNATRLNVWLWKGNQQKTTHFTQQWHQHSDKKDSWIPSSSRGQGWNWKLKGAGDHRTFVTWHDPLPGSAPKQITVNSFLICTVAVITVPATHRALEERNELIYIKVQVLHKVLSVNSYYLPLCLSFTWKCFSNIKLEDNRTSGVSVAGADDI